MLLQTHNEKRILLKIQSSTLDPAAGMPQHALPTVVTGAGQHAAYICVVQLRSPSNLSADKVDRSAAVSSQVRFPPLPQFNWAKKSC